MAFDPHDIVGCCCNILCGTEGTFLLVLSAAAPAAGTCIQYMVFACRLRLTQRQYFTSCVSFWELAESGTMPGMWYHASTFYSGEISLLG